MRAGFITPSLLVGGAEQHLETLVRNTDPKQVRWAGVALTELQHLDLDVQDRVEELCPVGGGWGAARQLARVVDVLVLWGIPHWWEMLPDPLPCPVIVISHGSGEWTRRVLEEAHRAAAVVAVSRVALEPLAAELRPKARLIYNGVDPERVRPYLTRRDARLAWSLGEEHRLIGYLGRFSAEKDCAALGRAAKALGWPWFGALVGRGPDFLALRKECSLLCGPRALFPGLTPDLGTTLLMFDYLLLASREEGFGLVIAEAWMAGTPVVCTPVGIALEHPELVRSIPIDASGDQLAEAFRAEEADPEGREARVRIAQDVARRKFSAERFGREWTELLVEVAAASVRTR